MGAEDARKLFVGGLSDSVTEEDLRALFEATGLGVVDVNVPRDRESGRPRGFGFVTLVSAEAAEGARARLDGALHGGRSISVRRFAQDAPRRGPEGQRPARADDRTVFLGKLPYDATAEEIGALFKQYDAGVVQRVTLPVAPDGRPRGFGFVTLESPEAASLALERLSRAQLRGRQLVVTPAQPRGPREGGSREGGSREGGFGRDGAREAGTDRDGYGRDSGYGREPSAARGDAFGRDAGGFSRGASAPRPGLASRRFEDDGADRSFGGGGHPSRSDFTRSESEFPDEEAPSFGDASAGATLEGGEGGARPESRRPKTKDKKKAPRSAEKSNRRERGGGGSWHRWESDED